MLNLKLGKDIFIKALNTLLRLLLFCITMHTSNDMAKNEQSTQ